MYASRESPFTRSNEMDSMPTGYEYPDDLDTVLRKLATRNRFTFNDVVSIDMTECCIVKNTIDTTREHPLRGHPPTKKDNSHTSWGKRKQGMCSPHNGLQQEPVRYVAPMAAAHAGRHRRAVLRLDWCGGCTMHRKGRKFYTRATTLALHALPWRTRV